MSYIREYVKTIQHDTLIPDWNHIDFEFALNSNTVLYEQLIKIIGKETLMNSD